MKKVAKVKKVKNLIAKSSKADYAAIAKSGKADTSGALIRARLIEGKREVAEIVKEVLKKFKGHTTKASDVYWNACQLRKQGFNV